VPTPIVRVDAAPCGSIEGIAVLVVLGVVAAVVVLLLVFVVLTYNGLVRRRNQVDNAWGQVDVQLTRRYDLIPNLVETVKGYARHEQETFDRVTRARAQALDAQGPAGRAEADNALSGALKSLFAVSEAYPDLKASANFQGLQQELGNTEDRTAYARQYYNDAVLSYNNSVHTIPSVLVAGPMGFRSREFFRAEGGAQGPVSVRF
jgi:LemA protein